MPFIGNQPALSYTSFAKQDFTTSATTSYTLDNPVANANELALFINFVRQEPTTAYSASGTTLTLTSATSSSDDMYCVYLGKAVQTVNPPNGSVGTAQLASGVLPTNTPYFYGELSSNQSITRDTDTKITGLTQNELDSASAFDGTTFTVPSGQGGKYYLEGIVTGSYADIGRDGEKTISYIYKNGSAIKTAIQRLGDTGQNQREVTTVASGLFNLSASDTIELYANFTDANASGSAVASATNTSLMGYKLIG
jgi:hypothetical protein